MKVLVTGVAGFIGMHCAQRLLARGDEVTGIDNLSPYYSVQLKKDRLARLKGLRFEQADIADAALLMKLFEKAKPDLVLHLAARDRKLRFVLRPLTLPMLLGNFRIPGRQSGGVRDRCLLEPMRGRRAAVETLVGNHERAV